MGDRRVAFVFVLVLLLAAVPQVAVASPPRPAYMQDTRVAGVDRYNTAISASMQSFPTTAPAVVLAPGTDPWTAELGMSLAGAVGGPVLLTPQALLPSAVAAEIARLHPSRVFVLGPVGAIGDTVITQLQAFSWHPAVTRIGGSSTFQIADAVAKQVQTEVGGTLPDGAFLLYGGMGDWTTLAAIAPYAYSRKMPILLSWYSHVSTEAIDAIAAGGIDHVVVANSEFYQGPAVDQQLRGLGLSVERVRETGQLGLAPAMAQHAVDKGWASYANIVLGSDAGWTENLAAGTYAGVRSGVFLFTHPTSLPFSTANAILQHMSDVPTETITVMGSNTVVSPTVISQIYTLGPPLAGAVSGTVTAQSSGTRLGGIHVTAWGWDPTSVSSTVFFSGEATTAADGTYRIGGLDGRRHFLLFQDPSHQHVDEAYSHAPSEPGCGDQVAVIAGGADAEADASLYDQDQWRAQRVGRLSGGDRYQTAIEISKRDYQSADTAVLVTGNGFADALSASSLCGAYQAPLFLVRYDGLPAGLVTELNRLGVKSVFIVGSDKVVSSAVVTQLAANGISLRERIGGGNRYATSAAVYEHLKTHAFGVPDDAFLARGDNFPDALAAAPAAFIGMRPILLVTPTTVPAEIAALFGKYRIGQVDVMGSEAAVSRTVLQRLASVNGLGVIYYHRFQGANRYATAANFVSAWYGAPVFAGIATGLNFPDALSGGVLTGSRNGGLLLTPPTSLDPNAAAVLQASASRLWAVRIFGGGAAVTESVRGKVEQTLGTLSVQSARPDGVPVEPGPKGPLSAVYAR